MKHNSLSMIACLLALLLSGCGTTIRRGVDYAKLRREHGKGRGIRMITHDMEAAQYAKTVLHLEGGVLH